MLIIHCSRFITRQTYAAQRSSFVTYEMGCNCSIVVFLGVEHFVAHWTRPYVEFIHLGGLLVLSNRGRCSILRSAERSTFVTWQMYFSWDAIRLSRDKCIYTVMVVCLSCSSFVTSRVDKTVIRLSRDKPIAPQSCMGERYVYHMTKVLQRSRVWGGDTFVTGPSYCSAVVYNTGIRLSRDKHAIRQTAFHQPFNFWSATSTATSTESDVICISQQWSSDY